MPVRAKGLDAKLTQVGPIRGAVGIHKRQIHLCARVGRFAAELLLALGIVRGGDVYAVVELLFIAQNLALDGLPELACKPGKGEWLRGAISFSPGVDYMERAYDEAKYGMFSSRPYVDMIIPTLVDPSMAPPGKHVISCFVQYAPYHLAPGLGSWDDNREAFGDTVVDRIAEFAPGIRDTIVGRQVLTPLDIERLTGLSEGNIFQGELSLEQLFFNRPVPGWARFKTPVRDLWLCGSATHPGGGIMGANGRLAALEVLRSRGRRAA